MTETPFDSMLDECLEAVLVRGEDIAAACSRFPEHEAELRQLAGIALQGRDALAVSVPPEAVAAGKAGVMAGVREVVRRRELEQGVTGGAAGRRFFLKPVFWVTAVFLLLMSGTAIAASGAEPDSFLYPVKQRLEEARTALAWQSLDRARTEVDHASTRLDEIAAMQDEGRTDLIPDLVFRFDLHIAAALEYANEAAADGEDAGEVYAMIDALKDRFEELMENEEDGFPGGAGGDFLDDDSAGAGPSGGGHPGTGDDYGDDDGYEGAGDSTSDGYHDDGGYPGGDDDGYEEDHGSYPGGDSHSAQGGGYPGGDSHEEESYREPEGAEEHAWDGGDEHDD